MTHVCDARCFLPPDATPAERREHETFAEAWDRDEAAWHGRDKDERARRLAAALPRVLAQMAGRPGSAFIQDVEDRPWWRS